MEILIYKNEEQASQAAFEIFQKTLKTGTETFGLATGSTPVRTYQLISKSDMDFSQAYAINLDEYYNIANEDSQSYHYYMNEHLLQYKAFKEWYIPDGSELDSESEIARFDAILDTYPIDLQLLGIGKNGHIGFNEPGSPFDAKTRLVHLTPSTIKANSRFFESVEHVPEQAYSMGLDSIMNAKHILLMAFGKEKADAMQKTIQGPVTEEMPASILQQHPQVTIILDEAAAYLLK